MCFNALYEASKKNELLLIDGGFCNFHIKRDGTLTIYEIISTRPGAGSQLLEQLKKFPVQYLLAKCPAELPSNKWYAKRGFHLVRVEYTRVSKKPLNVWCLNLPFQDNFDLL